MYQIPSQNQEKSKQNAIIHSILKCDSHIDLGILDYLLCINSHHRFVFPSQATIAKRLGVTRETVNRHIQKLEELGWFSSKQRWNDSCVYTINPIIYQHREVLKHKVHSLLWAVSVTMLLVLCPWKIVTLIDLKKQYAQKQQRTVTSFQKQLPTQHPQNDSFIKNITTPTSLSTVITPLGVTSLSRMGTYEDDPFEVHALKKGRVMEQSVMQLIASSYGLLDKEIDMLSEFSDEALQYAVTEKQRQKVSPVNVARWLATVAASFEKRKASIPKTGRMNAFQQKIVHGKTNNNHSPSIEHVKTDNKEREQYLLIEIAKLKNNLATIKTTPELQSLGERRVMAMEAELADLLKDSKPWHSNPVKIRDFDAEREQAKSYRSDDLSYERSLDDTVDRLKPSDPQTYKDFLRLREFRNKTGLIYK